LIASATSEDLELQRRRVDTLKLDTYPFPNSGSPIVRLLAEPSFTPDWVVSLYHAENSDCRAVAVLAKENVYYANHHESHRMFVMRHRPASIATTVYQARMPCDLADKVKRAWHAIISVAKRREAGDPIVVDGTEYTASSFIPGVGPICGYSHSPPDETPAAQLVELGARLLKFVQGNDAEKTNISVMVDELLAVAPQTEGGP
jgi:hypothetical protein